MAVAIRVSRKQQMLLLYQISRKRWLTNITYRETQVLTFGDGSHGALGLAGLPSDAYEPTPVPALPSDITRLAAGHYHSLAITSRGHLWTWGRDQEAQLGRGLVSPRDTWNEAKRVEGLGNIKVRNASASGVVSAAIGDDGSLWVWGKSKRGQLGLGKGITEAFTPTRVEALSGENICKVSFGWGHALALTRDHKLYGWGYSADGRLGKMAGATEQSLLDSSADLIRANHKLQTPVPETAEKLVLEGMRKEDDMPIIWDPCLVEEFRGTEVENIACGLDHSLVFCRNRTLLSSGSNVYGQLGRANHEMGFFPVDRNFDQFCTPFAISAGLGHSLALCRNTSSGNENSTSIISWGWNQSSQLGRVGPENIPMEVEALSDENLVSVCGGRVHSLARTLEGGLWVWGCGKNGRLGLGSSGDETEPVLLETEDGEVLDAVSGFDHNLVLTSK
ncbi:Regulator of chromosome condensation (RCC1) family protein [Euphorbia peplus]|nr:Regulator of chromosome condensation (RCC1) family protein [Euphorbia peplus]